MANRETQTSGNKPAQRKEDVMFASEAAQELRAELKARGWSSRDVSVRVKPCTYSRAIDIVIKRVDISKKEVEGLAGKYESVRRCEASGEILSGGNTYVSVTYDWKLKEKMVKGIMPACIEALKQANENRGYVYKVDGTDFTVAVGQTGRITAWDKNDRPYCAGNLFDAHRDASILASTIINRS